MRPADATRLTVRVYAMLAAVAAALGVGVALGVDPYPGTPPAAGTSASAATAPGDDAPLDTTSGQS